MELTELDRTSANWDKVINEIESLEIKTFHEYGPFTHSFEDELKKDNSGLLYVQVNDDVVGYVMYACPSSLSAFVNTIAVKEEYRRQGYGEALMKAAMQTCRSKGAKRVTLHVDILKSSAINLYKKLGFQIDTLLTAYYPLDQDAYQMIIDFGDE